MQAGLEVDWSIEQDAEIAEIASGNLRHRVHVADILDCDPVDFERVDVLHASPPCPSFSLASHGTSETALDRALALKTAEFVTTLRPSIFTLENVFAYRHSRSWRIIEDALHKAGYWVFVEHVNAADYGVPQTRKRMIVRAVRGGFVPYLPEPVPWVGWYAAVEDLLHTLPESQFAPWQMARLPELLMTTLVAQGGYGDTLGIAQEQDPAFTITANHNQLGLKAFLMQVQGQGGDGLRFANEPMRTVTANHGAGKYRAFLIGDQQRQLATESDPAFTVRAGSNGGAAPRAWLVDSANASPTGQLTIRDESQPSHTVTSGGPKHPTRALFESGRVVAMTPRALARFQSFPDWYELPDNARLAARGIGNAVPPLLYRKIIEPLLETIP